MAISLLKLPHPDRAGAGLPRAALHALHHVGDADVPHGRPCGAPRRRPHHEELAGAAPPRGEAAAVRDHHPGAAGPHHERVFLVRRSGAMVTRAGFRAGRGLWKPQNPKAEARLVFGVSSGGKSPRSRSRCGGNALLLEAETQKVIHSLLCAARTAGGEELI